MTEPGLKVFSLEGLIFSLILGLIFIFSIVGFVGMLSFLRFLFKMKRSAGNIPPPWIKQEGELKK